MIRTTIAAVVVAFALAGCAGKEPQPTAQARVVQQTFKFLPASVRVAAGSKVTWANRDAVDHTVTSGVPGSPTRVFDRPLGKKALVVIAFSTAGTFEYFCSIHNSMRGEVVVT